MKYSLSQRLAHFFHVVSNIRPIVWIGLYICAAPIFALIYWALPDDQFRIPEGDGSGYGSWLYYSIVTITTLGFGDYTPAHGGAQAVTAVEVMCGLIFLGLFLNAVGAMKSEIDVESEIEKQKALHFAMEHDKLLKSVPMVINSLNIFLAYCYAVTTPYALRESKDAKYDPKFEFNDMADMFRPSKMPFDSTTVPAVEKLMRSADQTSLVLDSLQQRIDLTLWPGLLEDCFAFVANLQMFANADSMFRNPDRIMDADGKDASPQIMERIGKKIADWNPGEVAEVDSEIRGVADLMNFIKENAKLATNIETLLAEIALSASKT